MKFVVAVDVCFSKEGVASDGSFQDSVAWITYLMYPHPPRLGTHWDMYVLVRESGRCQISGDFAGSRLRNQKPWGSKNLEKNTEALEMDLECVKGKRADEKASYVAVDKPC